MTIEWHRNQEAQLWAERRQCLQWAAALLLSGMGPVLRAQPADERWLVDDTSRNRWAIGSSNFHGVYDQYESRERFADFLRYVYSIYPPERFHALIGDMTKLHTADQEVYQACQRQLADITPLGNQVRNALPALLTQTEVVGRQLRQLLQGRGAIDGYMEIGTKGGYIGYARGTLNLKGDVVLLGEDDATYGLGDMFERRSLIKVGRFVDLNSYLPVAEREVATASLDVVCNPIGFHHSPPGRRDPFIASLRRCLRRGGLLLVRDHDVDSPFMNQMVALAHDVFNLGLHKDWMHNQQEIRHFTSLKEMTGFLSKAGFRPIGEVLYQKGDPTRNALVAYEAV